MNLKNIDWRAKLRPLYRFGKKVPPVLRSVLGLALIGLACWASCRFSAFGWRRSARYSLRSTFRPGASASRRGSKAHGIAIAERCLHAAVSATSAA